mmetsp:Transcript_6279/g.9200  ORF Transcript_6279/g.9200 Transcript_6279/m.9200 type:complete len:89 (+) Transcript_6279:199-465(+)
MSENVGPNLNTPVELIRLASAIHRFRCPEVGSKKLSFERAFKTSSAAHPETVQLMKQVCCGYLYLFQDSWLPVITYRITLVLMCSYNH